MKIKTDILNNEKGSVIVAAILILAILSAIGISANTMTVVELRITQNEQLHKIAFYNADSGAWVIPKIISYVVDSGEDAADLSSFASLPSPLSLSYINSMSDSSFFNLLMEYQGYDDINAEEKDVLIMLSDDSEMDKAEVDIEFVSRRLPAGGSIGYGEGYGGLDTATKIHYNYRITSEGFANPGMSSRPTKTSIEAGYRKVTNMPGGL